MLFDSANDENVFDEKELTPADPIHRQDDGRPVCSRHVVLMKITSSNKATGKQYYKCPVPECEGRETRAQKRTKIPKAPTLCPGCSTKKKPVALVATQWFFFKIKLECPDHCGAGALMVMRPDHKEQMRRYRNRD